MHTDDESAAVEQFGNQTDLFTATVSLISFPVLQQILNLNRRPLSLCPEIRIGGKTYMNNNPNQRKFHEKCVNWGSK